MHVESTRPEQIAVLLQDASLLPGTSHSHICPPLFICLPTSGQPSEQHGQPSEQHAQPVEQHGAPQDADASGEGKPEGATEKRASENLAQEDMAGVSPAHYTKMPSISPTMPSISPTMPLISPTHYTTMPPGSPSVPLISPRVPFIIYPLAEWGNLKQFLLHHNPYAPVQSVPYAFTALATHASTLSPGATADKTQDLTCPVRFVC